MGEVMTKKTPKLVPRHERTPLRDAFTVIGRLTQHFVEREKRTGEEPVIEPAIKYLCDNEITGDSIITEMQTELGGTQFDVSYALLIAFAYALQAVKASKAGDEQQAWSFASDARYWHGIVTGCRDQEVVSWRIKSAISRESAKLLRPKNNPTNKSMVIDEMRIWRTKGHTFNEFMEAAINDSIECLFMEEVAGDKFKLSWGDISEEKKSKNTILDWWTDCHKDVTKK